MSSVFSHSLLRFAVSGGLVTAASLSITAAILIGGGSRALAVSLGYALSSLLGYFLHSLLSFRRSLGGRLAPVHGYLVLLGVSAFLAYAGSGIFDLLFRGSFFALLLAIAFPVVVNFLLWQVLVNRHS